MAKLKMFSIHDAKVGSFWQPFCADHVGHALRSWEQGVNDPNSTVCKFPSDFALYEIGEFDTDTGLMESLSPVKMVATALEFKAKPSEALPFDVRKPVESVKGTA